MELHEDDSCSSILAELGENCTVCGCVDRPDDTSLRTVEKDLIIAAAVVFCLAAIFVGICLCRRNRAVTGSQFVAKTTTMTYDNGNTESLLEPQGQGNTTAAAGTPYPQETDGAEAEGEWARVRYNFTADQTYEEQISVSRNDRVIVLEKFDDGWWNVRHPKTGRVGIVPASYCTMDDAAPSGEI